MDTTKSEVPAERILFGGEDMEEMERYVAANGHISRKEAIKQWIGDRCDRKGIRISKDAPDEMRKTYPANPQMRTIAEYEELEIADQGRVEAAPPET